MIIHRRNIYLILNVSDVIREIVIESGEVCTYVLYIYVCVHVYVYVCVSVICIYVCICLCIYVHMYK